MATQSYQNYSFFDQFPETEIDLTQFIKRFSTETPYDFSNIQPVKTTLKNLFELTEVVDSFRRNVATFERYNIVDGERIENVSFKKYGTVDWWWIIALFNEIKNPFTQWPMNENQIVELVDRLVESENKYSRDAYYQMVFERNEERRSITIPLQQYIPEIVWLYSTKSAANIVTPL